MSCTSTGPWGTLWAPSMSTRAPAAWAFAVISRTGLMVPSAFETWLNATSLGRVRSSTSNDSLVEPALLVDGHELQVRVLLLDEQLPGHQVGVVLQLREHDRVRLPDVAATPGVGDEVDGLGRVAHEHDLGRRRRVDEPGRDAACRLVGRRGLLGGGVDAPVDVGREARVVRLEGVQHRLAA